MCSRVLLLAGLIAVSVFTTSCKKELTEQQLKEYIKVPDNGVTQTIEYGGVNISLTYYPSELLSIRHKDVAAGDKKEDEENIYSKNIYFLLELSTETKEEALSAYRGDKAAYNELLNELNFEMGEKVFLLTAKDTLPLLDYIYPRFYGTSHSNNLLLAFENRNFKSGEIKVVVKNIFKGHRDFIFEFNNSNINQVPQLKKN